MAMQARRGGHSPILWGGAGLLLLLPLVAMQFTREVQWTLMDFAVFGAMLATTCAACELGVRATASRAYRAGISVATLAGFLLVWVNLAVGVIGNEGNPANLLYAGVLAVAILGAVLARSRPQAMARTMLATALAQALAGLVAWAAKLGATVEPNWPRGILLATAIFVPLWLAAAWLFGRAAREQTKA